MAAGKWTSSDLLTSVKRRAFSPSNQNTLSDSDILDIATEELHSYIVPLINGVREGYFEYYEDFAVTSGTTSINIPDRAVGGRINYLISVNGTQETLLPRLEPTDTYNNGQVGYYDNWLMGPVGYYIRNHKIVFRGTLNDPYVRVYYFARPGDLVETTAARQVTAVGAGSLTLSSALGTLTTGTAFDIIRNVPGFVPIAFDQTATVAGSTLTFTPPSGVAVGDWVALANQSPIPQVPYELHPLLRERVVATVLQATGYKTDAQLAFAAAAMAEEKAIAMITLRADKQRPSLRPNRLFRGGY